MKKRFERDEIRKRLRDTIGTGKAIVGAGCSAGLIARAAEVGGADLIICYSTGQSRIRGLQTVNIDHANPQTLSMYDEISNVVRDTPIIAGVEGCDQTVYDLDTLCGRFVDRGVRWDHQLSHAGRKRDRQPSDPETEPADRT